MIKVISSLSATPNKDLLYELIDRGAVSYETIAKELIAFSSDSDISYLLDILELR